MSIIQEKFAPFNSKDYSSPWICKVIDWPNFKITPNVIWGKFVGSPRNGGYVTMVVEEDDIIKTGQKRYNNSCIFVPTKWYQVFEGKLIEIDSIANTEVFNRIKNRRVFTNDILKKTSPLTYNKTEYNVPEQISYYTLWEKQPEKNTSAPKKEIPKVLKRAIEI